MSSNLISLIKHNRNSSKLLLCLYYCMVAPLELEQNIWKKARWKLHKDAACCFEQILEAAPYKTAAVQPFTSHLTNDPSKTSKMLLEK